MSEETNFLNGEIQEFIEELKQDREKRFLNTGVRDYSELGLLLYSYLNICQNTLFDEHFDGEESHLKIDVYNLLETAKNLLPHNELEFLDKVLGE